MGSQPQKSRNQIENRYQQPSMQTSQMPQHIQMQYRQPSQQINMPMQYSQTFQYNHFSTFIYNQSMIQQQPPSSQRSQNINTQPRVIKNDFCIEKLKLVGNENFKVEFTLFALSPCKIQLYVQCLEICHPVNKILQEIRDKLQYDEFLINEPQTMNVVKTSKITIPKSSLQQKKSINGQAYQKLLLMIQNKTTMMAYYYDYENDQLKLVKQKFQNSDYGAFEVEEIYGINDSNLIGSMKHDQDDGECIICLSEKINTIIMPCRHMCLCGNCAKQIMDKKEQLRHEPAERQQHAPDYNLCPQCRMEIDSFIKLQKIS
ncbi:unnamed protein product (macronuclear) [Paramecium tetraurelia]|uniref:RING-type domain-containing protein n=1 Tax=Paramecium tetraurelia TaxID=5888 RepID=A0DHV7_PARTE|nr:uncharacterized protein GSPATT00039500001 [Paramecium tetraurelia]CAK82624.1 unnamed protein product [Paramecium tetraurelia]|eukprot:XP_001450021.1 hypothetical protein (macronuclear) [Paramecium tetraurelia strain d4-2]